jgi:predicted amidohydrolase
MNDVPAKKVLQARAYITAWGKPILMDKPSDAVQYADLFVLEIGDERLELTDLDEAAGKAARLLISHDARLDGETHKDLKEFIEIARDRTIEQIEDAVPAPAP